MSKSLFIFIVIVAAGGYYLYKTNRFTEVSASFDITSESVSVTALRQDLHDCNLRLTNDFNVDLPFLRQNSRLTINKYDFKQWNGTSLDEMKLLGPEIEFKLRCKEGGFEIVESNRYLDEGKIEREKKSEEVIESN